MQLTSHLTEIPLVGYATLSQMAEIEQVANAALSQFLHLHKPALPNATASYLTGEYVTRGSFNRTAEVVTLFQVEYVATGADGISSCYQSWIDASGFLAGDSLEEIFTDCADAEDDDDA